MLDFCRKLAVFILIAGLPLQNMHAVAMPLCNQDEQKTVAQHEHAQQGDAVEHQHDDGAPDANLVCGGCGLCQACSAPAIASVAIDVSLDTIESPPATPLSHISLFVPEQPQRPPRV